MIHLYNVKDVTGVSIPAFVVLILNAIVWFIYGYFFLKQGVMYVGPCISLFLVSLILVAVYLFKK